ncbi:MAG: cyclic pyranopterin monophosphate synthase MoaC [Planctomycetes bacterium]|nr:cyclic pyranopterin monophosphate synthase MoaC [Planctomycetota bacterium]
MNELSHFDDEGASRMVDVGAKEVTKRAARASGLVRMAAETLALIRDKKLAKGDVLEVARLAGIMAAKRTADLIPLCHPLALESVSIGFEFPDERTVRIEATAEITAKTGVEMEALTAVSVAALTIYDMCKAVDRGIEIDAIRLEEKSGGRSGHFTREAYMMRGTGVSPVDHRRDAGATSTAARRAFLRAFRSTRRRNRARR